MVFLQREKVKRVNERMLYAAQHQRLAASLHDRLIVVTHRRA